VTVNVRFQNQLIASKRFAAANGWRCGEYFGLDLLIRSKSNHGHRDFDKYGYHLNASDHPEYLRIAGKLMAIVAHSYAMDVDGLRRLVSDLNGALVLHQPPAGKAASWYFPGHALPMCLTRPDITEIVWPTNESKVRKLREALEPQAAMISERT
jgi:hypothetical protein